MAELADVARRLEHLGDALETGKLTMNDLAPWIQALRHKQDQLEAAREELKGLCANRRAELSDLELVVHYVEDLRNLLDQSPLVEQKTFICSFIKVVRVTNSEAVLI